MKTPKKRPLNIHVNINIYFPWQHDGYFWEKLFFQQNLDCNFVCYNLVSIRKFLLRHPIFNPLSSYSLSTSSATPPAPLPTSPSPLSPLTPPSTPYLIIIFIPPPTPPLPPLFTPPCFYTNLF